MFISVPSKLDWKTMIFSAEMTIILATYVYLKKSEKKIRIFFDFFLDIFLIFSSGHKYPKKKFQFFYVVKIEKKYQKKYQKKISKKIQKNIRISFFRIFLDGRSYCIHLIWMNLLQDFYSLVAKVFLPTLELHCTLQHFGHEPLWL